MKISPGLNLPLWLIAAGLATILPAAMLIFGAQTSMAASATWLASPQDQYWGNANNWTLGGPPGHLNCPPCDTATFNTSSITDVVGDGWGGGSLDGIVFTGDAFTITTGFGNVGAGFFLNGAGIINNSGRTQNIVVPVFQKQGYSLTIENNATAGINTVFTVNGGAVSGATGAFMGFSNNSTAASGTFTVNGGAVSGATGAFMGFSNNSTAASGTFTVNGGAVSGATGASMAFTDNSTAASGTFTVNGGTGGGDHGLITFTVTSTAGNAILIANGGTGYDGRGGTINFSTYSTGGTSRVKVFDNGNLDISSAATNVAIGSIEGTGNVFLGSGNLTVGTNNLSTSFSGRVSGSGQCGGSLGSLAKVGSGTLTFEGRQTNDYLADTVGLILVSDSVINLNFTGPPDEIASLVVNDVPQPAGLYGSPDSGAPHPLPEFAGPGTVQVGSCKDFTQSETSVVSFGNTIVFGFNDFTLLRAGDSNHSTGWLRSTDGGVTWANGGALPNSTAGDAGDPVLARDASSGRIYFATLPDMPDNLIQVFRSTDDGATWIAPVNGAPEKKGFQDKEWITVDNFAGSGQGNVYLVETDFGLGGIYLFRSTDAGSSFGPPGGVPITSGNEGGLIYPTRLKADSRLRWPLTSGGHGGFVTVMPDHSVYVFWLSGSTIQVRKSIDQGQTFAPSVTVVTFIDPGGANGDLGLQGLRNGIDTFAPFRTNRFPHVAINPVSGNMYVAYNDKITSSSPDNSDIFFVQSTDGGAHWSTRTRVNDDGTTTDQWFPNVVVSPGGDKIGILYYSRQEDAANNNLFKYYGRIGSISGGTITFSPSAAVGDTQSLPEFGRDGDVECEYMGDYDQAYAREGSFDVVWSDNRNDLPSCSSRKDPDVFYRRISLATPTPTPTATHTPTPTPTPTATHTPTPTPTASPACMAAAVTTGSATNIASNSATLSGTVNPNGCNTTVHFQYGTTTSYGSVTANQNYNGNTTHNVTGNISGLTASTTYHFRIVATNSAGTRYGSDRTFTTLSATGPPAVTTNPAANIASFSATLNGSLDPHGLTTTAHFQYGTTISYGSTTASQTKTGNTYRSVSANIIGLSASTTYHFRIVATNSGGTTYGSDRTFTTLSATGPPVVTTKPATNVASSSATLNGLLDPHGLTTSVQFQYGTTTSYGNDTPMQSQTGNTYRNIAANIGGLAAHTTYHFRIVATNSVGTRYGSDRTFTTQ